MSTKVFPSMISSAENISLEQVFVLGEVPSTHYLLISPIFVMLFGACMSIFLRKKSLTVQYLNAFLFFSALLISNIFLLVTVLNHGSFTMTMGRWLPPFGISFLASPLSALLCVTASMTAFLTCLYTYVDSSEPACHYGFYPFFMVLMAGINGAFLTADIFNLYVWFEVVLISSFGLLVLGNRPVQLEATIKYAFLNFLATTLFLIAIGLLYGMTGALNFTHITQALMRLPEQAPLEPVIILFLFAFLLKAAAFPLHFWLPASYHTPRIAVTALFAALITKLGLYALIRVIVTFSGYVSFPFTPLFTVIAILTLFTGIFGALAQSDLRRAFAYLIISGIGFALAGVAINTKEALFASFFYIVMSILVLPFVYISMTLMARRQGSFDLKKIACKTREQTFSTTLLSFYGFLGIITLAGFPPFFGFWPKFSLLKVSFESHNLILFTSLLIGSLLTILTLMRLWLYVFWREESTPAQNDTTETMPLLFPPLNNPALLMILCLFAIGILLPGLFPGPLSKNLNRGVIALLSPDYAMENALK